MSESTTHDELRALRERVGALTVTNAELSKSELRLAGLLDLARIGSWELDVTTGQADWSAETRKIIGVGVDAPAAPGTLLAIVHPDDRDEVRGAMGAALDGSKPYHLTYRVNHSAGGERVIHSRADVLRDDQGRPLRMIGLVQDITQQEALRRQLLQAQKLETVGRLAGGLAHDLNNLLTVIFGSCELIAETCHDGDPCQVIIRDAKEAAARAAGLTSQLLAFSRQQVLQPQVVLIDELLARLRQMLARVIGEDVVIASSLGAPGACIRVDPQQFMQVVLNLAINARDAMPDGGHLSIATDEVKRPSDSTATGATERAYVRVTVSDTGHGMDTATLERIFEPFFTTKPPPEGTGLGLSTVYGIVSQSGGLIEVDSAPGRGTTFEVLMPCVAQKPSAGAEATTASAAPPSGDATVMVVEDDVGVLRTAVRILERRGYRVLPASSGHEALALAETPDAIDVVLTDMVMPGVSGRQVADSLRAAHPGVRVVFMSGFSADPALLEAPEDEGVAFLQKPFTAAALLQRVDEALRRRAARG